MKSSLSNLLGRWYHNPSNALVNQLSSIHSNWVLIQFYSSLLKFLKFHSTVLELSQFFSIKNFLILINRFLLLHKFSLLLFLFSPIRNRNSSSLYLGFLSFFLFIYMYKWNGLHKLPLSWLQQMWGHGHAKHSLLFSFPQRLHLSWQLV